MVNSLSAELGHDQVDQRAGAGIQQTDDDHHSNHEDNHNRGIVDQLFTAGPCDLAKLAPHVLERIADLLDQIHATLAETDEDVGLGILGMRVLEIDMAGLKKQPKNPLMAKVPASSKATKSTNFLQENLKNKEKISHETDIKFEENEYSTSLEDNEMNYYNQEEEWQNACAEDYEAIEAQRAKLEERQAARDKRSIWSGWEKFLGKD